MEQIDLKKDQLLGCIEGNSISYGMKFKLILARISRRVPANC